MKGRVVIHTDGACSGNPGPGGWGVVMRFGPGCVIRAAGANGATVELRRDQGDRGLDNARVSLYANSQYVKSGITGGCQVRAAGARGPQTSRTSTCGKLDARPRA
jgi:ribonuclease HI